MRKYFDIAAIHPYTLQPSGVLTLVRRFRTVMKKYGDARKPVWVTEFGLPASRGSSSSKNSLQTTPRGMARFLTGTVAALARQLRKPRTRVARVYWYTWASEYQGDIFRYAGLFRYAGDSAPAPEAAYGAYAHAAQRLEGCAKTPEGICR
jgi:hypothetical protein